MKRITGKRRIKRDFIIEAARKTFKKYGFKKTTMSDIAKTSGNGKSSIYYYFESKEEIFQSVVLNEAKIYRNKVIEAIRTNTDPYEKLKAYILIRLQTDKILSNFHKALKDPKLRYIGFVVRLKKLYDKEEYRLFQNILQDGVDSGFFEISDIKRASVGIVTAMRGIENTLFIDPDSLKSEKQIENILKIVLYGIVKR